MTMIVLIAAALIAAYTDLRTRRIPNWLTAGMIVYGLAFHSYRGGWSGFLLGLGGLALGGGLILIPMLIPFARRGLGGGDVKFLAAVGSIVGAQGVFLVFILATALGAILGGIAINRRRTEAGRPVSIPYGVALSFGTLMVTVGTLIRHWVV